MLPRIHRSTVPNNTTTNTANNPNTQMLPWINGSTLSYYSQTNNNNPSTMLPRISRPSLSTAVLHDNSIRMLSRITRSELPAAV